MKPYYDDGKGIVIYHGDCREIVPQLGSFDLLLTDPPYVIKHVDGGGIDGDRPFYKQDALAGIRDFDLSLYAAMMNECADSMVAFHSRDQIYSYAEYAVNFYDGYDLHLWHKSNPVPFTNNTWLPDVEYICLAWRGKKIHAKVEYELKSKVFKSGIETGDLHPAQKPIAVFTKYIRVLNPQTIIDPFAGSGTTGRAAKDLGRKCTMIEREEKYCEIAANRLSQEVFNL
jgi:DNA modification methylase